MMRESTEIHLSRVLSFGGFLTTIFVAAWWTTEPVNAPKMLSLTTVASICMVIILLSKKSLMTLGRNSLFLGIAFVFVSGLTLITSDDPLVLNLYGVAGRSTGFITYFSFIVVFVSSVLITSNKSIERVLKGLTAAGLVNVVYCLFSIAGIELLPWNNIYNTILGTFGNPNFISAFLGIFSVVALSFLLKTGTSFIMRISVLIVLVIAFIEILVSNAIQGLFVLGFGSALVLWMKLREVTSSRLIEIFYALFVSTIGMLATFGALQIGPLAKYIYKSSVSLRGEYWQAAWNMGMQHPLTGVGMDSYGSWYRRARGAEALISPGVNTTTNAAHNVFLDIFAYGGFPLLITYLAINLLILKSAIKLLFRSREYDFISAALVSGWICYQAQSIISINQIGLAIWGWILGGLLIAYERLKSNLSTNENVITSKSVRNHSRTTTHLEPGILVGSFLGFAFGLAISIPPVIADASWRTAMGSGNGNQIAAAAQKWPLDQQRLTQAVDIFNQNNWPKAARLIAEKNISIFSNSYMAWFAYLQLSDLTDAERVKAISQLHRLDPNNPEFK
jgi:O-antigen ligase